MLSERYRPDHLTTLHVVLKTVERCNIACSYCYFFDENDGSWRQHTPSISLSTIDQLIKFLVEGLRDLPNIASVRISFHGGEPTMQKKAAFDEMCTRLRASLTPVTELELAMQSNGVLLDEEWVELLLKHEVACSISLDGPPECNDSVRPDHRGRGTHMRAVRGLRLLQQATTRGLARPSIICVVNPNFDAGQVYRHFVEELGISEISYLLPTDTKQTPHDRGHVAAMGAFLSTTFAEWARADNPDVRIGIAHDAIARLLGQDSQFFPKLDLPATETFIVIGSSGHIIPDDALTGKGVWDMRAAPTIFSTALRDYLDSELMHWIKGTALSTPTSCGGCDWKHVCSGGQLMHRFHPETHFDNPTVWCGALIGFLEQVFVYLVRNGVPQELLRRTVHAEERVSAIA